MEGQHWLYFAVGEISLLDLPKHSSVVHLIKYGNLNPKHRSDVSCGDEQ